MLNDSLTNRMVAVWRADWSRGWEWSGETSQEAVAESLTGDGGGSWVYKTPLPLAVMCTLSAEKHFEV